MDNSRKLVTVRQIDSVEPIVGADAIEVVVVGGWKVVVKKGEFTVGDKCVYFEIDSFLPDGVPAWQFLVDKSSRTFEGIVGHKLRTIKLRGQVSQGFVMPLKALPQVTAEWERLCKDEPYRGGSIGDVDFSDLLGIKKWEAALSAELAGQAEGVFPSFIRKTDQERCQNLVGEIFSYDQMLSEIDVSSIHEEAIVEMEKKGILKFDAITGWTKVTPPKASRDDKYEVTMKLDGSSMTVFAQSAHSEDGTPTVASGVCSRNLQLKVNDANADNTFISVASKSGLLAILEKVALEEGFSYAVQGELMGPGIQGNQEKLTWHQLFVFDVQDLGTGAYLTPSERQDFMQRLCDEGLDTTLVKHVPILHEETTLQNLHITGVQTLLEAADGPSLNPQAKREGLVFKRTDGKFSFKAISNSWLLKSGD